MHPPNPSGDSGTQVRTRVPQSWEERSRSQGLTRPAGGLQVPRVSLRLGWRLAPSRRWALCVRLESHPLLPGGCFGDPLASFHLGSSARGCGDRGDCSTADSPSAGGPGLPRGWADGSFHPAGTSRCLLAPRSPRVTLRQSAGVPSGSRGASSAAVPMYRVVPASGDSPSAGVSALGLARRPFLTHW